MRDLLAELADARGSAISVAIDPMYPAIDETVVDRLIAAASGGATAAAGSPPDEIAALATNAPAPSEAPWSWVALDAPLVRIVSRQSLVELERKVYMDRAEQLLRAGLLIRDPATTRIDGPLSFGVDVEIEPGCTLHGPVTLGDRVRIGQGSIVRRAAIASDVDVRPFTTIEDATIGARTFVGPYARVRPGTAVGADSQIGNFVELKAARLGRKNRINHLSFVGDATFGDEVTLGAGTITCNHDGVRTQLTTIADGAYIGSGCVLVAPIAVGEGATVGAGSTLTKDAPPRKLTLARTRQLVVDGWKGFGDKKK